MVDLLSLGFVDDILAIGEGVSQTSDVYATVDRSFSEVIEVYVR